MRVQGIIQMNVVLVISLKQYIQNNEWMWHSINSRIGYNDYNLLSEYLLSYDKGVKICQTKSS